MPLGMNGVNYIARYLPRIVSAFARGNDKRADRKPQAVIIFNDCHLCVSREDSARTAAELVSLPCNILPPLEEGFLALRRQRVEFNLELGAFILGKLDLRHGIRP